MNWHDYRKKLGLSFDDSRKVGHFSTVIKNYLTDDEVYARLYVGDDIVFKFCNITGSSWGDYPEGLNGIIEILEDACADLKEYLAYIVALINCLPESKQDLLISIVEGALDLSGIAYETIRDCQNDYYIFPQGAAELDKALVSEPLDWLVNYPKSRAVFVQALRKYSNPSLYDARTIADEFRKALEGFFQEFFNSEKTLENLKSEYGNYMKKRGIPPEISNSLEKLQKLYTDYMNDYVKHQNNTQQNVLEYIMYQTGNIIRLLITLKNAENEQ